MTLPSAAYLGNTSGALVSPQQAADAAYSVWSTFVEGIDNNDTAEIAQVVVPGTALQEELDQCAWPSTPSCAEGWQVTRSDIQVFVPVQTSFPLSFLAEMHSSGSIIDPGGSFDRPSILALVVFTRASAAAPWKIALRTAFDGPNGTAPIPLTLPADQTTPAGYDPIAKVGLPISAKQIPSALASYWQHWKSSDSPPPTSLFLPGVYTSAYGTNLGKPGNGPTPLGTVENIVYSAAPVLDGLWVFSVDDSLPLVCSTVRIADASVPGPHLGRELLQNPSRTNWGPPLAPGNYLNATTYYVHRSCVLANSQGRLTVFGADGGEWAASGATVGSAERAAIAACHGDAENVLNALKLYRDNYGSFPRLPEPWDAANYWGNYATLGSEGNPDATDYVQVAPDASHYVIEYDLSGRVWIDPPGIYDNTFDPKQDFATNPNACDVAAP